MRWLGRHKQVAAQQTTQWGPICYLLNFRELSDLIFLLISFRVTETFSKVFSHERKPLIPEAYLGPAQHLRSSSLWQ